METFRWALDLALAPLLAVSGWLFVLLLKCHRNSKAVQELIDEAIANRTEDGLVSGNHDVIESEMRFRDIQEQNGLMEKTLREKEGRIAILEKYLQKSNKEKQTPVESSDQQDSEDLKKKIEELQETLEKTDAEKKEALTRLSRVVSLQVRDGNPSIVDLSDDNRPDKLAELSNEIYDNQWLDAFDELEKEVNDEISRIQLLLDIIMTCYTFSIWKGKTQMEFVNRWFIPNSDDQSNLATQKQLKDARKQKAMECLPIVERECIMKVKECVKLIENLNIDALPGLQAYLSKCIKLCWMMTIQDPPCVMLCPEWRRTTSLAENNRQSDQTSSDGDRVVLNKDLYKTYTQNGDYIQYIVWPCMLHHKGGQTLNKGVAQGCD